MVLGSEPTALLARLETLLSLLEVKPVTLAEWRTDVLGIYASRRPSTRYRTKQALDLAIEVGGADALTSVIDPAFVTRVIESRPHWRPAYMNGVLRAFKAACKIAQLKTRRWIGPDQLESTRWIVPENVAPLVVVHPRADVDKVLTHLASKAHTWRGHRLHALACVYAFTGVRAKEALQAKLADLDLVKGVLWVWPNGTPLKTEASRQPVPVCDELRRVLERWIAELKGDWLFPIKRADRPWLGGPHKDRPTARLVRAGKAVGVRGFTPQSLRHTLASHAAGYWGLSQYQIKLLLRHSNLSTQGRYVHAEVVNLCESMKSFTYASGESCASPTPPAVG